MRPAPPAVFDARFAGDQIDTTVWRIVRRAGNNQGTPDAELQFYAPDGVTVRDGAVHLTATASRAGDTLPFTSGRIETRRAWLYGHVAIRARLPRGRGLWPALWLRTPPGPPLNGEIDIVESYGSAPNLIESTLHDWHDGQDTHHDCAWLVVQPVPDSPRFHTGYCTRVEGLVTLPRDLADAFHTYAIDWSSERIVWSFDGTPYFEVRERVPHVPMMIVLNLAVGGGWDGVPDPAILPRSLDVASVTVTP